MAVIEQMDAFAILFQDNEFYKRVMSKIGKAMYLDLKNGK